MKKIILKISSLLLIVAVMAGVFAFGVNAETVPSGAENDTKIYFEVPEDWINFSTIYCHIWERDGEAFFSWQTKKEKCKDEGNGIWSYDTSVLATSTTVSGGMRFLSPYTVIFSNNLGQYTYDLAMSTECIGDTVYTGETVGSPISPKKIFLVARWRECGSFYHPIVQYDYFGNLIDPDNVGIGNERPHEVIYYILGDLNLDGYVDITDATLLQRILAEIEHPTEIQQYAADTDWDRELTIKDVTAIQNYLVGKNENFSIGAGVGTMIPNNRIATSL